MSICGIEVINKGSAPDAGGAAPGLSRHDIETRARPSIQTELAAWRAALPGGMAFTSVGPSSSADRATASSGSSLTVARLAWCTDRRIRFSPSRQPSIKIVSHSHPSWPISTRRFGRNCMT